MRSHIFFYLFFIFFITKNAVNDASRAITATAHRANTVPDLFPADELPLSPDVTGVDVVGADDVTVGISPVIGAVVIRSGSVVVFGGSIGVSPTFIP